MSARERILARIRSRQGKAASATGAEREAVRAHIAEHNQSPRPRADWDPVERFCAEALRLESTVDRVETLEGVPVAVARYLRDGGLPLTAVCWDELADLPWSGAGLEILVRETRDTDLVGITGAFCAIAETGTLMTVSGPRTPAATSLLPETHVAVVRASRIVRAMEEAWALVRRDAHPLPRAVSFISGPSRSADIEQTVTLGAHGPYRVHIIVVP